MANINSWPSPVSRRGGSSSATPALWTTASRRSSPSASTDVLREARSARSSRRCRTRAPGTWERIEARAASAFVASRLPSTTVAPVPHELFGDEIPDARVAAGDQEAPALGAGKTVHVPRLGLGPGPGLGYGGHHGLLALEGDRAAPGIALSRRAPPTPHGPSGRRHPADTPPTPCCSPPTALPSSALRWPWPPGSTGSPGTAATTAAARCGRSGAPPGSRRRRPRARPTAVRRTTVGRSPSGSRARPR